MTNEQLATEAATKIAKKLSGSDFGDPEHGYSPSLFAPIIKAALDKATARKVVLLKATHELLKKHDANVFVESAMETVVHYDDADCDGSCLMEDIATELELPEP